MYIYIYQLYIIQGRIICRWRGGTIICLTYIPLASTYKVNFYLQFILQKVPPGPGVQVQGRHMSGPQVHGRSPEQGRRRETYRHILDRTYPRHGHILDTDIS